MAAHERRAPPPTRARRARPAKTGVIRTAIRTESVLLSEEVTRLLETSPNIALVSDGADAALPRVSERSVHVVLLDGSMRLETSRFPREGGRPWAIVLTTESDVDRETAILQRGARGVLCRANLDRDLLKAIRSVHDGQIWARMEVVARLVERVARLARFPEGAERSLFEKLSEREVDVVRHITHGASNREIAERLHLSQAAVKAQLSQIFRKLDVRDRAQLAALYHRTLYLAGRGPD